MGQHLLEGCCSRDLKTLAHEFSAWPGTHWTQGAGTEALLGSCSEEPRGTPAPAASSTQLPAGHPGQRGLFWGFQNPHLGSTASEPRVGDCA